MIALMCVMIPQSAEVGWVGREGEVGWGSIRH